MSLGGWQGGVPAGPCRLGPMSRLGGGVGPLFRRRLSLASDLGGDRLALVE